MTRLYSHTIEVRFRDCDPLGHVNNAVYLTYLEQARFAHWRAQRAQLPADHAAGGLADVPSVIVARNEIDYRRPARFGERLRVDLGIGATGRSSFTYEYEIVDAAGQLVAAAKTVMVRFDYAAGRPVPLSDELRAALTRDLFGPPG